VGKDCYTSWVGDWVGSLAVLKEKKNYCCHQESDRSYSVQAIYFTDRSIMGLLPINQLCGALLGKLMAMINE
jgi:hypothetical protein